MSSTVNQITPVPANYAVITADAVVKGDKGILLGIVCVVAGTIAIYDNASAATGTLLYPATALTAGQVVTFGEYGIRAYNGLYADWTTSGTFNVLYL